MTERMIIINNIVPANRKRIQQHIDDLAKYNATPGKGTTRVALSEEDMQARNLVKSWMAELNLPIREDAIGNIYGTLLGKDPSLPPVWTGSHIDTVLQGGNFDGTIGVIGGIEAVRMIKESNLSVQRNVDVVVFTAEEPVSFGLGCLGSRALAGKLKYEDTLKLKNQKGEILNQVLQACDFNTDDFSNLNRYPGTVKAYLELHIEQGAVLEELGVNLGIVSTICAPTDIHISVIGKQGHAGATPMNLRRDAMMASAEIALYTENLVKSSASPHTVGTIGRLNVYPNASNVIPQKVDFTIDIRDSIFEVKKNIVKDLSSYIEEIKMRRKVEITMDILNHDIPQSCDPAIVDLLQRICESKQMPFHIMVSGAYHDAMHIAQFAPMGMIFVPSRDGISHSPHEWTDMSDIANGVEILADTIYHLANN